MRTLHIMRWYANTEDRRRIMRQLNKGEALHDLRAALVIANKGHLRHPRGEHLAHQASCLNLVTNAVIVWNTVCRAAVVEQLKHEGYPVQDSDLAHVWPTRYAHINVYGKYHFNVDEAHARRGLRPLRAPGRRGWRTKFLRFTGKACSTRSMSAARHPQTSRGPPLAQRDGHLGAVACAQRRGQPGVLSLADTRDYRTLFPRLPERTRLFRLFKT